MSVRQRYRFAQVARTMTVEKRAQGTATDLQDQIPQAALDLMKRPAAGNGRRQQINDLRNSSLFQFHLEKGNWICDVHGWVSLRVDRATNCKTIRRRPSWPALNRQQLLESQSVMSMRKGGYAQLILDTYLAADESLGTELRSDSRNGGALERFRVERT